MKVPRSLPLDLAGPIAERVLSGDVVDYISFRAVCRGWRSRTASPNSLAYRFRPRKWFMLTDGDANLHAGNSRRFLNLRTCRCLLLHLPELDSHSVFAACDGLLILIEDSTRIVRIFNPFTRYLSDLPPLPTIGAEELEWEIGTMIHLFNASISDEELPTVVMYSPFFKAVYFAKPGDEHWQFIVLGHSFNSLLFCNGQWYFAECTTGVHKVDLDLKSVEQVMPFDNQGFRGRDDYYLVKINSEIFVVRRKVNCDKMPTQLADNTFDIFWVDLEDDELVPIDNIGDLALFVGFRGRILVFSSKDLPSIERNSVYFCIGVLESPIGLYDLGKQEHRCVSVGTAVHDLEKRIGPSIRPYTLVDHLAAYGVPLTWAAGLMCHEFMVLPKGWFTSNCDVRDLQKKYSLF